MVISRYDVYLTRLDPSIGREMRKTRPTVVVSPDEMNRTLGTVIIAPLTTKGFEAPSRVPVRFSGREGKVVLDQIRTVDKSRLVKKLGALEPDASARVSDVLVHIFTS